MIIEEHHPSAEILQAMESATDGEKLWLRQRVGELQAELKSARDQADRLLRITENLSNRYS